MRERLAKTRALAGGPGGEPGASILVADDHPIIRWMTGVVLREAGLAFEFVEDGAAALAAVQTGRFDLVLMDVDMPRMSGLEAARAIRRLAAPLGAIPIIAVTARITPREVAECREAGMNDHVAKPINAQDLLQRVALHLQWGRLHGAT